MKTIQEMIKEAMELERKLNKVKMEIASNEIDILSYLENEFDGELSKSMYGDEEYSKEDLMDYIRSFSVRMFLYFLGSNHE